MLSFFGPRKPTKQNVPRVATPPLVHAEPIQQINTAGQTLLPPSPQKIQVEHDATLLQTDKDTYLFDKSKGCPHAIGILQKLQEKMDLIPKETAPAGPEHPLAVFSENPAECTNGAGVPENDWEEILNPKMKSAFGWGRESFEEGFAQRGLNGLDGFVRFIGYFVTWRGLKGSLIEMKVETLLQAIEKE